MGAGRACRCAGGDRLYPLRRVLRDVHDRKRPARGAGLFPRRRGAVGHGRRAAAGFVAGVVVASVCRRHFWVAHPHGPTVLTTFSLVAATVVDVIDEGWEENQLDFAPIMLVAFGIGALNTSFVKDGEVSVPLSYVTGTLVKMGQGIERHIAGGNAVGLAGLLPAVQPASSWAPRWVASSACSSTGPGCWCSLRRCAR